MPAQVVLKALGLIKSPNPLSLPEGAQTIASNVIIKRDDVIESRRGFKLYGTQTATIIKQLLSYKTRILRHFGSTLQFDTQVLNVNNESIFSSFSGVIDEVQTGLRIKSVESNGNFYFTTAEGIKKISAADPTQLSTASGYVTNAGGVKAINGQARIDYQYGNSTGFLPEDSTVAYRIVWGINDANNNLILGTPSERIVLYNPLMGFLIPDFDTLLGALDDISTTTTTAFISDTDYVSTLKLSSSASSSDLKNQLISLAAKIDEDILYANDPGTAPLNIATSEVASNVATITFSAGNPLLYFVVGSKINLLGFVGAATVLNGSQTIASVTATTITFNITTANFGPLATSGAEKIESYEYRYAIANISYQNATFDLNTTTINNPATNTQLNILQGAITGIIDRLNVEPVTVISSANQTAYIAGLDVTTSTNVILNINIPQDITSSYFLQIYRSDISTATGVTLLSDLTPNDEMQLVYEANPTSAELSAGTMQVLDEVDDAFAGANLYTNPATGEGILQANDVPPLAKDINRFKNVVFYANTKTRQRLNLNLLGVTNFKAGNVTLVSATNPASITTDLAHNLITGDLVYINGTGTAAIDGKVWKITVTSTTTFTVPVLGVAGTVGYWTNSMVAIIDSSSARQYYFIKGVAEVTNVATVADVANSLNGTYFTINSGKDQNQYYVWYKTSGGPVSDPAPAGKIGIRVDIATGATANSVASRTIEILSRYPQNWSISGATNNVIITNVLQGVTTDGTSATSGFTVSITQQGRGEYAPNKEVLLSTAISPAQAIDESARSLQNVVNENSSEATYIYYLSGLSDVPGKLLIEGRSLSSGQFSVIADNSTTGDSFSPSITPTAFISNETVAFPTVITTTAAHGLVSGNTVVIAFSNSTPLINGEFLVTNLSPTTFSIPVNVTSSFGTDSSGALILLTSSVYSNNEEKSNRVYYSKLNQPEAVPLLNYFDVGSQENEVYRIFPLRDSLFVFKKDEGLYRISGENAPFNLALFDSTCHLRAPDSPSALNNQIFCWTDEGIETVSESGVQTISRNIDTDILKLGSSVYPNFSTCTWGIGYHSDQAYIAYTNSSPSDTIATIGYRYNLLTQKWTTIDKTENAGIINNPDDKLYMAAGDVNYIEQERKNFDRTDYADREIATSLAIGSYFDNGLRLKIASVINVLAGDVLAQDQYVTAVNFNALLAKLDLDAAVSSIPIISISTGSSPLITIKNFSFAPADVNTVTDTITVTSHGFINGQKVRFVSSGTLPTPLIANTDYFIVGATANTFQVSATLGGVAINITTTGIGTHTVFRFHNLSVGDFVTLTGTDSDPNLNGTYSVVSVPNGYSYTITPANPITTSGITGTSKYNYSMSQQMVGGDDIRTKLIALANKLDTDCGTEFNNYSTIIAAINLVFPVVTFTVSATNPTVITTSTPHGFENGRYVTITGSNSTPSIDGNYIITYISSTSFSIPVSVQIAGTITGNINTLTSDFRDLQACYNAIVTNLNLDPGVIFNNYQQISSTTSIESLITAVNSFTNEVTLASGIAYLVGPITIYRAIESIIQYSPQTMQDPLGYKHMTTFTMMFENKVFTEATVGFASDLLPEFIEVPFNGDGNGIFGHDLFGAGFFGGGSHGAPFRTYFPQNVMRCRYFLIKFTHRIAREQWSILGITSDGSISQSTRAYRR